MGDLKKIDSRMNSNDTTFNNGGAPKMSTSQWKTQKKCHINTTSRRTSRPKEQVISDNVKLEDNLTHGVNFSTYTEQSSDYTFGIYSIHI